ncbi:MAG: cytochrome c oxidase assembly protein [Chloroflexi bacterium]|nr:MAG: cytochrome c oxidase assembly protein [Chloroflexota bacterium]
MNQNGPMSSACMPQWSRRVGAGLLTGVGVYTAALAAPVVALAHGPVPPAPTLPGVLLAWTFNPLPLAAVVVAAVGYWWLARRVARRHPRNPVPRYRHWAWGGGLAAVVVALLSPVETYSGALLTVHMFQHLLLQFVAAPLLLLAAPVTLVLRAVDQDTRRTLLVVLHSRIVRVVTFPLLALFLFAAVNWGWHFSELYDHALEVEWVHVVQHATLFGVALLFWFPVIGADPGPWRLPYPARLFYLFLAMPQNSFLGVAIMNAAGVLYPHYATLERDWGPDPLIDQQAAGTLMWVWGDLTFLLAMLLVIVAWVRQEERRTARDEARQDAEAARQAPLESG